MGRGRFVAAALAAGALLATAGCAVMRPSPFAGGHGALVLAFDGNKFPSWKSALELFGRYDARVTFFISGRINRSVASQLHVLTDAGHSIGLGGIHRHDPTEQMPIVGKETFYQSEILPQVLQCREFELPVRTFAYPAEKHSQETDDFLFGKRFSVLLADAADGDIFVPVGKLVSGRCLMKAVRISDKNRQVALEPLKLALRRCAERNEAIAIVAKDIELYPKKDGVSTAMLAELLALAKELGVAVVGLNDI